jgi:hypothetical protein
MQKGFDENKDKLGVRNVFLVLQKSSAEKQRSDFNVHEDHQKKTPRTPTTSRSAFADL